MTPYTTPHTATAGGVQIGLLYTTAMPIIQGHALTLQTALLDKRTAKPLTPLLRLIGCAWMWL